MIHIVYAINGSFSPMAAVSIKSLQEHSGFERACLTILSDGLCRHHKEMVSAAAKPWKCDFVNVGGIIQTFMTADTELGRYPAVVMARLAAELYLPDSVDSALYIDSDTLITGSLAGLAGIDLGDYLFAGILDRMEDSHLESIGMKRGSEYVNSGVLLMNIAKMRQIHFFWKVSNFLNKHGRKVRYPDQDAINSVAAGQLIIAPMKYNVLPLEFYFNRNQFCAYRESSSRFYSVSEYAEAVSSPAIVHFASSFPYARPWHRCSRHPYSDVYQQIMNELGISIYEGDDRSVYQSVGEHVLSVIPQLARPAVAKVMRKANAS